MAYKCVKISCKSKTWDKEDIREKKIDFVSTTLKTFTQVENTDTSMRCHVMFI